MGMGIAVLSNVGIGRMSRVRRTQSVLDRVDSAKRVGHADRMGSAERVLRLDRAERADHAGVREIAGGNP